MSFPSYTPLVSSADSSPEKYLKKLLGKTDIEDALKRLDKLTQDEVRMATAQLLTLTHGVDHKVTRIDDEVKGMGGKVTRIDDEVQGVSGKVRDIDDKVRVVHEGTQYVMLSYSRLLKRLCGQMERKQEQSCNLQQVTSAKCCVRRPAPLLNDAELPSHNREPVATGTSRVVLISRSVDESCYTLRRSAPGNSNLVLPGQSLRRVEVLWVALVDPWEAYVL